MLKTIIVANSSNITFRNQFLSDLFAAIEVGFSRYLMFENCTLINNTYGIFAWEMDDSKIENCTIKHSMEGMFLQHSDFNTVRYNNISENEVSIHLMYSANNTIEENVVTYNERKAST